jgi:hypothetical protein
VTKRNPDVESRRCRAHSSRTGEPCKKFAIKGALVCATHGGSTRHIKRSAQERLKELQNPALVELERILRDDTDDSVKLRAVLGVLDRTGLGPHSSVELQGGSLSERLAALEDEASD